MDAAALGAKILASLTGSAARWAWKKVRGDERLHVVAKVSCDTLASAVLDIAKDKDFAITDAEVELLTGLIGEVLDPGSLMEFCGSQIAEEDGHSREEFIADLINRLEQHRWIDVNTTPLPVRTVLGEFLRLVPQQIEREAKKPGSPLLGLVLIAKLNGLRCAIGRNKQSSISESREPLYSVRTILKEPLIGRRWLLKEVNIFLQEHDRGYFLIEANAGLGKATFACLLARELKCAAHFAWLDPDAGTPEVAVRSLGAQLIATWELADLAPDGALPKDAGRAGWLDGVLHAAAEKAAGKPIVLVVDGLDAAAEHPHDHLPLGLPDQLPKGVYVVATARTAALRHFPENIRRRVIEGSQDGNLADLREYLVWAMNEQGLSHAIAEAGVSQEQFIELLLDRSGGVWVYVHYVLEEIRQDPSAVNQLPNLPRGLEAYYHNNLLKLCGGPDGHNFYTPLLATLAVAAEPVDAQTLAALAGIDEWRVEDILDHRLRPYCAITPPASKYEHRRFGVYHPSLSEYLAGGLAHRSDATAIRVDDQPASMSTLRDRLARACRDAHHRICDRYLTAWGGLDRDLPDLEKTPERLEETPERGGIDRGYALRWLTTHLLAADREADLHRLLACGPGGHNTWFAAHDSVGDLAGYLRDVERARNSAPRLGLQLRYALIEASITSLSTTLPPVLVDESVSHGLWSVSCAFSHVERMRDEQRRAQTLARIAHRLPDELLGRALSVAVKCRRDENRVIALQAVIPRLPTDLLDAALDAVLDIENAEFFAVPMVAIAARLPKERLRELPWQRRLFRDCAVYREAAVALFLFDDRCQGAREALATAQDVDNKYLRGLLVAALLPHVPGEVFDDVLAVLRTIEPPRYQDAALIALARHCPAERLGDLFDFAFTIEAGGWKHPRAEFFQQAALRLTEEQLPAALRLRQAVKVEEDRAEAFEALAPRLNEDQAREFLARLQNSSDEFYWSFRHIEPRILVVGALADRLAESDETEARAVVSERLRHLRKQVAMAEQMAGLARYLPTSVRSEALSDLFHGMSLSAEFAQKGRPSSPGLLNG